MVACCKRTLLVSTGTVVVGMVAGPAIGGGGDWLTYVKDNERLMAEDHLGLGDTNKKSYAWGDVNNNGWIDLVVVRMQPWGVGKRQNVLFMNEEGTLVDRSVEYASAVDESQLPAGVSDDGFLTPTLDAACLLADLTNNGWLEVVTAVTVSDGDPKHIGYPRVYLNLGNDGTGAWQGFRFENDRMPEMLTYTGLSGFNPRFESVAAGDVTVNGFADLYFGDSDNYGFHPQPEGADFNDRLLVNTGAAAPGYFTDGTADAFSGLVTFPGGTPQPFVVSGASWSVAIADVNGNGAADILKSTSVFNPLYIGVAYNDLVPGAGPGVFDSESYAMVDQNMPYHFSLADLNNNGRLDLVITTPFADRYRLNSATGPGGHVIWGPSVMLPGPLAFSGNSIVVDLDNSGWKDIIVADVAAGIPGCNRQMQIYRSNEDGAEVTFSTASTVIPSAERQGVFDVAAFDITGNGWTDLVLGRCSGTSVWVNTPQAPCTGDLTGSGAVGVADLLVLLAAWGPNPGHPADLTGNGTVGVPDLLLLLSAWGPCP